jgi:hypothetical protein
MNPPTKWSLVAAAITGILAGRREHDDSDDPEMVALQAIAIADAAIRLEATAASLDTGDAIDRIMRLPPAELMAGWRAQDQDQ